MTNLEKYEEEIHMAIWHLYQYDSRLPDAEILGRALSAVCTKHDGFKHNALGYLEWLVKECEEEE